MTGAYERLARPLLFRSAGGDPELVHERTLRLIARVGKSPSALRAVAAVCARHRQPVRVAGIEFPARVGLAAGMDKDGVGVRAWSSFGFGHAELGTVTAEPQPGNERPRLFRVPASSAIINRMGFNNAGAAALARRLDDAGIRRGNRAVGIPLGISLGKNKTTPIEAATANYLTSFRLLAPYADYVAINVSSPNTPGLRALQDSAPLRDLTAALIGEAHTLDPGSPVPIFVKIAPDLGWPALDELLDVVTSTGVAGLVATNTTLARDGLAAELEHAAEPGGLSGAPLTRRAREVVAYLTAHTDLPVIGCGGILTAADGQAMLDAGAQLLQIYTGFIYRGPALVAELNRLRLQPPIRTLPTQPHRL